jgi:hypothetical protein
MKTMHHITPKQQQQFTGLYGIMFQEKKSAALNRLHILAGKCLVCTEYTASSKIRVDFVCRELKITISPFLKICSLSR